MEGAVRAAEVFPVADGADPERDYTPAATASARPRAAPAEAAATADTTTTTATSVATTPTKGKWETPNSRQFLGPLWKTYKTYIEAFFLLNCKINWTWNNGKRNQKCNNQNEKKSTVKKKIDETKKFLAK